MIGFGDDLVGVLLGLFVTAFGVYKAFGDRIALPGAGREELPEREVIDVTPVPEAGFEGYTRRAPSTRTTSRSRRTS
ncbi:MAG: hypothetical protein R3F59_16865 [Myxococcota bacterium]